jgi:oxysterol-binding protein-related protein 9/10/11
MRHISSHIGLLRGALSVTVGDVAYVTCARTKLKAILHYVEDGWLGRAQNKVEGVVFKYDPENDDKVRIRDVPESDVVARLGGGWKDKIVFTLGPKPVVRTMMLVHLTYSRIHTDKAARIRTPPTNKSPSLTSTP